MNKRFRSKGSARNFTVQKSKKVSYQKFGTELICSRHQKGLAVKVLQYPFSKPCKNGSVAPLNSQTYLTNRIQEVSNIMYAR